MAFSVQGHSNLLLEWIFSPCLHLPVLELLSGEFQTEPVLLIVGSMRYLHPNHAVVSWAPPQPCWIRICPGESEERDVHFKCALYVILGYTKIWKPPTYTSQMKVPWFLQLKGIITTTDITTTTSCILSNIELLFLARVWMEKQMSDEKMCAQCNRLNTFHLVSNWLFFFFFGWNSIWWVTSGYVVTALNSIPLQKGIKREWLL